MSKKFLICPNCERNGVINVLAEVKSDGKIAVLRFHNGETLIDGDSFTIVCGRCGEPVYIRKRKIIFFSRSEYEGTTKYVRTCRPAKST